MGWSKTTPPARLHRFAGDQGGELRPQPQQASHQLVEVHGEACPLPFGLDLVQASQQELPEAQDLFDERERRLRNSHSLVIDFLVRGVGHLQRQAFAIRCVDVTRHRAAGLAPGRHAFLTQRAGRAGLATIHTPFTFLAALHVTLLLGVFQTFPLWAVVEVVLGVVNETRFVELLRLRGACHPKRRQPAAPTRPRVPPSRCACRSL